MAYRRGAQREVSQFIQAGFRAENDLYLDRDRAGSARDSFRDMNRRGYRDGGEGPEPLLSERNRVSRTRSAARRKGFLEILREEAAADKTFAAISCFLLAVVIGLGFVYAGQLSQKARNLAEIADYNRRTEALTTANGTLQEQLTFLTSSDRIHNLAQNTYGMLRRERAETSEIYIRMPEKNSTRSDTETQNPKMEVLDILLGVMDHFNIGG